MYTEKIDQLLARIDHANGNPSDTKLYFYLTDKQNSVLAMVDPEGTIQLRQAYRPTKMGLIPGVGRNNASLVERYGYTDREFEDGLNLQYNRARYLDVTNLRWLSEDPLEFGADDANTTRYAGNNPTGATDPSGLIAPQAIACVAGGLIGGVIGGAYGFLSDDGDFSERAERAGAGALSGAMIGAGIGLAATGGKPGWVAGGALIGAGIGSGLASGLYTGRGKLDWGGFAAGAAVGAVAGAMVGLFPGNTRSWGAAIGAMHGLAVAGANEEGWSGALLRGSIGMAAGAANPTAAVWSAIGGAIG